MHTSSTKRQLFCEKKIQYPTAYNTYEYPFHSKACFLAKSYTVKNDLIFPSPAVMSLIKLSLEENN
jgi:hypothetical protein